MSGERKYEHMADWLAVKAAGGDAGRRPVPERLYQPSGVPQAPVPDRFPVSFPLREPEGTKGARNRRRLVNELLAQAGVKPGRR